MGLRRGAKVLGCGVKLSLAVMRVKRGHECLGERCATRRRAFADEVNKFIRPLHAFKVMIDLKICIRNRKPSMQVRMDIPITGCRLLRRQSTQGQNVTALLDQQNRRRQVETVKRDQTNFQAARWTSNSLPEHHLQLITMQAATEKTCRKPRKKNANTGAEAEVKLKRKQRWCNPQGLLMSSVKVIARLEQTSFLQRTVRTSVGELRKANSNQGRKFLKTEIAVGSRPPSPGLHVKVRFLRRGR